MITTMSLRRILLLVVFGILAAPAVAAERYVLPLVGPYAIRYAGDGFPAGEQGAHQLIETYPSARGGYGGSTLVTHVDRYACDRGYIVGKARDGYFLLNGTNPGATPEMFESVEPWRAALVRAGVRPDIYLDDPDARATTMPSQVVRPWEYRMMGGLLGQSDYMWALIVQCLGMFACFLIGWRTDRKVRLLPSAVGVGIAANIVGQILIAGGGPGAFVGFFFLPVVYLIAGHVGRLFRRLTDWLDWHPIRDRNSSSRAKPARWRDRIVIGLATFLVLGGIQCILTGGALPFYGSEPLSVALATGWSDPLAWTRDRDSWFLFLIVMLGAGMLVIYALARHPLLRWIAIVPGMVLGLLMIWPASIRGLLDITHEFLFESNDGEEWEFAALVVFGWWGLLWLLAGVSELFFPMVRPATARPRGFEPVLAESAGAEEQRALPPRP